MAAPDEGSIWITHDEAEDLASQHRGAFGDDVVLHDPQDHGDFFACEDCDWIVVYLASAGDES